MKHQISALIVAICLCSCSGGSGSDSNGGVINTGNNGEGSVGTFNVRNAIVFDTGEYLQINQTGKYKNVTTDLELDVELSVTFEGRLKTTMNNVLVTPVVSVTIGRYRNDDRGINIPISGSSTSYYDSDGVKVASDKEDGISCSTTERGSYPIAAKNGAVGIGETEICSDGSSSREVWQLEARSDTVADIIITSEDLEADDTTSNTELAIRINNAGDILGFSSLFSSIVDGDLISGYLSSSNSKNLQ